MLDASLEDEPEERFEEELRDRTEDKSEDSIKNDAEEDVDVCDMAMVDKEGDSIELVLDDEDDIGAYVKAGVDEAVVPDADTRGQDDVKGCGQATTPELKLRGEDWVGKEMDNEAEKVVAVVMILGEAGAVVAPQVHTDTHVQTDEHVHENVDACVQDTAVASESEGMAPGGNGPTREKADDCDGDNVDTCSEDDACGRNEDEFDACDRVGCGGIESDTLDVREEYTDDDECNTSDDVEDDIEVDIEDAGVS